MHADKWVLWFNWTQELLLIVSLLSVNSLSWKVNWHSNERFDWFCASYQNFVEEHVVHQRGHFLYRGVLHTGRSKAVKSNTCSPSNRLWGWYAYVDDGSRWVAHIRAASGTTSTQRGGVRRDEQRAQRQALPQQQGAATVAAAGTDASWAAGSHLT